MVQAEWDTHMLRYAEARDRIMNDPSRASPRRDAKRMPPPCAPGCSTRPNSGVASLEAIDELQATLSTSP